MNSLFFLYSCLCSVVFAILLDAKYIFYCFRGDYDEFYIKVGKVFSFLFDAGSYGVGK